MVKEEKSKKNLTSTEPKKATGNSGNTLGILTHLLGLFTGFLGPLIILLATNDKKGKDHSRYALNWQFSALIYSVIGGILSMVFIGFIILGAVSILNIIFCIIATVEASKGELWNYPLSINFFNVKK